MTRHNIAVIPGDGIGPEVVEAALPVLARAARLDGVELGFERFPYGAEHFLATGETLPEAAFQRLEREFDAILVGALGDPRVPQNEHARDILLGLRFRLDLYINFRPVRLLHPRLTPLKDSRPIDFVVFRENTEGPYGGRGRALMVGTPNEEQISEEVHTWRGVTRILEAAFAWAEAHGRTRITLCDKANAIPFHRIWAERFQDIGANHPGIEREHRYIDALALDLVRSPERFQLIVTNNLYGDIVSDLGAGLVGGLGLAPSANLHPGRPGLFEPVHGSAPPLAGTGTANPMAAILTGALLLESLGYPGTRARLEAAVQRVIASGPTTPDLGGGASTDQVAEATKTALG